MIDVNDPLFRTITGMKWAPGPLLNFTNLGELCSGALPLDADTLMDEFVDSFVLVDFVPTSENICKHIKQYVQSQIKDFATVVSVELWETAKSHCKYTGE
jgi:6-pyruvoyltetrahydropterin/6-carboxytetrahydropterin synthase